MGNKQVGVRAATKTSIRIDFYCNGVRCRERLKLPPTPANLKYAAKRKAQIELEIALGTFDYSKHFPNSKRAIQLSKVPGATIAIGSELERWLKNIKHEIEHTTLRDYELAIRRVWIPWCGTRRLTELSRADLKTWVAEQSCGLKRIRNLLLPLRGMFSLAVEDGLVTHNPFVGWTPRKVQPPKEEDNIDPFDQTEIAAILGACDGQIRNLFEFSFWSGVRTSELIALRWEDVNLIHRTITVRRAMVRKKVKAPKTRSGRRTIQLLYPALQALINQQKYSKLQGAEVFLNPRTNKPWIGDAQIRKTAWQPALKRAGVRYRYPYQTRHTFASTLLSRGENPIWVAAMMGHKDWTMIARVYGRWIPSLTQDAGQKVAALWNTSDN